MSLARTLILAFILAPIGFAAWAIAPILKDAKPVSSTKILARDGSLLYEVARPSEGLRTAVSIDRLPKSLLDAVIATEDQRFFSHSGFDRLAMIRAVTTSLANRNVISGGSTIEMQLIKNLYFRESSRSPLQKLREITAAEFWAQTHTKNQTLETYLNTVPLGNGTNGVASASSRYFRKDVSDLTIGESALLAGMINGSTRFDPYTRRTASLERRRFVLTRMVQEEKLTQNQFDEIIDTAPTLFTPKHEIRAPHFVERVLAKLEITHPDIRTGGYTVKTSLDPTSQEEIENIVVARIAQLSLRNVEDAAAIAIDPITGDILAYVGSADYWDPAIDGQVDMVTARRQPGSALKPFLVLDMLRTGFTPASVIADLPVRYDAEDGDSYYPRNFNTRYYGPVTLRDALGSSLNVPMVKLLEERGLRPFFATLNRFGINFPESPEHYGRSVILGGGETTLHDVTRAYAMLALYGRSVETRDVLEIRNAQNQIIWQAPNPKHDELYQDDAQAVHESAALVADILSDDNARSLAFGEANLMETGKRVAIKSGTTRDFRDNLAFGYTPNLAVGVWVGNADGAPMQGVSGVSGSVPILHDILLSQLAHGTQIEWPDPGNIVIREICLPSGKLATDICPKRREEKFRAGTEPKEIDDWWKLAKNKTSLTLPAEYADWVRHSKYEAPEGEPFIIAPLNGDKFVIDDRVPIELQSIPFTASAAGHDWILNGKKLSSNQGTLLWKPVPGEYELKLSGTEEQIRFSVR